MDAKEYLVRQMAKGSPSSRDDLGRQQMQHDFHGLTQGFCRKDAVGRISKKDLEALNAAEEELNSEGYLDGRLNGYPLVTRKFRQSH